MKRSKKLVSTLLVALMACSMAITPAFAEAEEEQDGSQYIIKNEAGIDTLPLTKYLTVAVDGTLPDVNFYFSMTPKEVASDEKDSAGNTVLKGEMKTGVSAIYSKVSMNGTTTREDPEEGSEIQKAKATGGFTLSELPLADMKVGYVYRYTVAEVTPSNAPSSINTTGDTTASNITYDTHTYTADLYIGATSDGTHIVNRIIVKNPSDNDRKSELVFTNVLKIYNLTIEKVLAGDSTNADDEFTFRIKIPVGGDAINLTAGTDMKAYRVTTDSTGNRTETLLTDGDAILVGGEKGSTDGWCTFKLKGGEQLVIKGVALGMIYYVQETDSLGYTTAYTHVTGSNTLANAAYTDGNPADTSYFTIEENNNIVAFRNTKNQPNTGIRMDLMPYVIVFLGVAACAVVLVARKRRNAR